MDDIRRYRGLLVSPCTYYHIFEKHPESHVLCVILYGHLRSYSYSLPITLKYLKTQFKDIHFFVHTWNTLDIGDSPPIFSDGLSSLLQVFGTVVAIRVDRQLSSNDLISPLSYMYYSMWSSNLLKRKHENNCMIRYSRCLKIRPDILFDPDPIQCLPNDGNFYFHGKSHLMSDICALTSSHEMDRICNFLINIPSNHDSEKLLKLYFNYLINDLSLAAAPFKYGRDWSIIKSLRRKDD